MCRFFDGAYVTRGWWFYFLIREIFVGIEDDLEV